MRISQLEGQRVALWGWGREGRAAYRALRGRLPQLPLTLFCQDTEAAEAAALRDEWLTIETVADAGRLGRFDLVVKSPGISPYRPEAQAAIAAGTRFIGGTTLWFGEHPDVCTLCVTGTKGKSTSAALLAHLLRSGGHRTALAGNIGLPLLELLAPPQAPEFWTIELSSYQTRDVAVSGVRPDVAVMLNLYPEHLDWHGSQQRYVEDKLSLLTEARPRIAVLNAADPLLVDLSLPDSNLRWFNREDGWHLRGEVLYRMDVPVFDTASLPLPGRHNRVNLCAVLTVIEAIGIDAMTVLGAMNDFQPLPHRLQRLGERGGMVYVNDSISTTPHASLAALDCFHDQPVAILVGGYDRGLDWSAFADRIAAAPPASVVTLGMNGPRIHSLLAPLAARGLFALASADGLEQAIRLAEESLGGRGVVLLSPGAPSFGAYRDYTERGRHFARLTGFDPNEVSAIPGLGIT